MMKRGWIPIALCLGLASLAQAREAKVVRSPSYHDGKVAFSYLGDIWVAQGGWKRDRPPDRQQGARPDTPGSRPTARPSPFPATAKGASTSTLIPATGGEIKRLTQHSADDTVLGWSPDGKSVLFASQRGEDFMGKLYTVSVDGGAPPRTPAPTWASPAASRPTAPSSPSTARPRPTGGSIIEGPTRATSRSWTSTTKTFKDLTDFDGMDSWPLWSHRRPDLLRLRPRPQLAGQHLVRPRERRRRRQGHRLQGRRRPVPLDLLRWQDDRLRARFRDLQARPGPRRSSPPCTSTSPPRPRRA